MISSLKRLFGPYFQLPAGVWALSTAILVNRAGNFVGPFLALYLTQKAGYTPADAGLLIMLIPLATIPALLLAGWLADHWGRRRVLVASQALAGFTFMAAVFAPVGAWIPVCLVVSTVLTAMGQIGHNAMLNDFTQPENRKTAFSLNYLAINVGFSVGPLIAGFLFHSDLKLFFFLDGLTTLGSAALVYALTKETLGSLPSPESTGEAHAHGKLFQALRQRPLFVAFLAIAVVSNLVYGQHTFSLPLQLTHDLGEGGASAFGILMAVNGLVVVLGNTVLTRLTGRFSSLAVVALANVLYAVGFALLPFAAGLPSPLAWFVASTVIWTVGEILASLGGHVFLASQTPANHRGRFNSVRSVLMNVASALSTGAVGLYVGAWGVSAVWLPVCALAVAAALLLLWLKSRANTP